MTDTSRAPDWRNEADYEYINALNPDQRRWEFLRRSDRYQRLFDADRLSNPGIACANFGIVGEAPAPATRGCDLPGSFRFMTDFERMQIGQERPVKPLPAREPTIVELRFDLEASIAHQIRVAERGLLELAAKLARHSDDEFALNRAKQALAIKQPSPPVSHGAFAFAQLAGGERLIDGAGSDVTSEDYEVFAGHQSQQGSLLDRHPDEESDEAPALNRTKVRAGQRSVRHLRVLDARRLGATYAAIAEHLFKSGQESNARSYFLEGQQATLDSATTWP